MNRQLMLLGDHVRRFFQRRRQAHLLQTGRPEGEDGAAHILNTFVENDPQLVQLGLQLGGLLGPITNQYELKDFPGGTVDNDCARSSKTWAQSYQYALSLLREVGSGGVAMGTDFNGLNQQPGPRYGPQAAAGLKDDTLREKRRPVQQRLQRDKPPLPYSGTLYRTDVPFVKARAGSREFDFNTDGLAHVGLLPDFIRDLVHVGMTDAQMDPLFSSAEAFLRMWEACESRGAALTAGEPVS